MNDHYDIVVVGAGPAGMAAALVAAEHGASVLLVDEQSQAGGQIYRAVDCQPLQDENILGADYYHGRTLVQTLAASDIEHVTAATVWQVSAELEIGISCNGTARLIQAQQIILATGAQERPFPIPGWTLPGVMTAGAAQILLKSSGLAMPDAIFAGTGPLLYLIAHQYLRAGIPIRAILDTTANINPLRALPHLPGALSNFNALLKGRQWISELRAAKIPIIKEIKDLKCHGSDGLTGVEYQRDGHSHLLPTAHVFLHQGVVPNVNLAMAAGCNHHWSDTQLCWQAEVDDWCESNIAGIAIAGDGTSISGALAAEYQGRIAGLGALVRSAKLAETEARKLATPYRRTLNSEQRIRPFLDALFRPSKQFRIPQDDTTLVCRCEEVTAGQVREAIALGCLGPNQLKGFTRCGMGPCQGRFCGLTVSEMIAQSRNVPVAEVGALRLRPPVKPLLLGELAALTVPLDTEVESN
jgi:NADPH-dependent 2,4-dienoyl-CoA reductase/sulfur reductase-like enzyme